MPFQPGHNLAPGGPRPNSGRKPSAVKNFLRNFFANLFTEEEMKAVILSIIEQAKKGDVKAAAFLFQQTFGTADERLAEARADLAQQQIKAQVFLWQALFLKAQAEGKQTENELWFKQFVTEEEELSRLQKLAQLLLQPLLHMTPETATQFGMNPDQLQSLKALMGSAGANIIERVFEEEAQDAAEEEGGEAE